MGALWIGRRGDIVLVGTLLDEVAAGSLFFVTRVFGARILKVHTS